MDSKQSENILFIGFNQDYECFMSGLDTGYRIYNTDPLKENAREDVRNSSKTTFIIQYIGCNYVGIVGGGNNQPKYSRNKAIIWDDYQKKVAISLEFSSEVLAIKLRRDRIAVVFEKLIKVFTFSQTPQMLHVFETYQNPNGLCCLCSHSSNANLVHLGKNPGHVVIFDLANTEKPSNEIIAHEAAISYMTLSVDGTKLATSSIKGTLIRVFDTENGILLHELRRGANHANIFCINFNKTATKLVVSSDHGTIHVFVLDVPEKNSKSSLANAAFLPKYFNSKWSTFKFDIDNHSKCICAFSQYLEKQYIIAICQNGSYYRYLLDSSSNTKGYELDLLTNFLELSSR